MATSNSIIYHFRKTKVLVVTVIWLLALVYVYVNAPSCDDDADDALNWKVILNSISLLLACAHSLVIIAIFLAWKRAREKENPSAKRESNRKLWLKKQSCCSRCCCCCCGCESRINFRNHFSLLFATLFENLLPLKRPLSLEMIRVEEWALIVMMLLLALQISNCKF